MTRAYPGSASAPAGRALLLTSLLLCGCVVPQIEPYDYTNLLREQPRSVVVVPVLNNSHEVGADELFLATISLPVAERGYYVFPVNLTRELLLEAGLADPGLVHATSARTIGQIFGADAVLYVTIDHWEAKYILLTTTVEVNMTYSLRSGKTGDPLWAADRKLVYQPTTSSSGEAALIEMIVDAIVTKAAPNYIPLARQANHIALGNIPTNAYGAIMQDYQNPYWQMSAGASSGGQVRSEGTNQGRALLLGPYHPQYGTDDPAKAADAGG